MSDATRTFTNLLTLMGKAGAAPVCLVDFPREGGATYYSLQRMREFLAQGKGVLRVTCASDGSLLATAHFRDIQTESPLPGIHALAGAGMPRFGTLLVNELVGWTLPDSHRPFHTPVGEGRPRWVPALTAILAECAAEWNARLEYVVHDYFPVCPNFSLLRDEAQETYCGVPGMGDCEKCLAQPFMQTAFGPSFPLAAWRAAWDAFLARANRIICPSHSAKHILLRAFSAEGKRIVVIPHAPLVCADAGGRPKPITLPGKDTPMHIAVVGQINVPKGAKIVRDLALLLREKAPAARLTLVGTLAAPGLTLPENVTVTGRYDKENLRALLQNIGATVGFIPSVCPETFNYVCQELMQMELPLVCFDVGAPPERIGPWARGLVAEHPTAESALAALLKLDAERF